jgi:ribose transport system permease protein
MKNRLYLRIVSTPPVIWIILALFILYSFFAPGFFSASNLWNIGVQAAPLLVLAIGATLVILTEGIDLSCGIVLGFAGVGFALLAQHGFPIWLAMVGGILLAGVCGLVNGVMVACLDLPPFIATLGMASVITGAGLVSTEGMSIAVRDDVLEFVSNGAPLGIKMPILIALVTFGVVLLLMRFTAFGRNIHALGGNSEALRLSGVNLTAALIAIYAVAGLLAGIAGILVASRTASGHITAGLGWDFDAIAATIIGGTSFEEGKGGVAYTILGVILIAVLRNGLNVAGVPNMYQFALIGTVVLGAIIFDILVRRLSGAEESR